MLIFSKHARSERQAPAATVQQNRETTARWPDDPGSSRKRRSILLEVSSVGIEHEAVKVPLTLLLPKSGDTLPRENCQRR